ncbi:MAG: Flp family type IVb pilin [Sphingomonadaceae bacterium]|nr:Flp family type IVb pilin [Sphingomonadaceae bacterium]
MRSFIAKFARCRRGATAIEYGLICACVVLAMIVSLKLFASATINMWTNVNNAYQNANS